jgi:acrylyl-CoA reductase (NADPH)
MYSALLLRTKKGDVHADVCSLDAADLPAVGDEAVLLEVLYSSLNYKDGLAVTGTGAVIRGEYPMVPGIDLVGRVQESRHDGFDPGDLAIGTGWQLGEAVWGGYTQQARVNGNTLVPLPEGLTPRQSMIVGTAGLTAMLAVLALEEHGVEPGAGEVVVTGASGGAGSIAVALLGSLGYAAVASTGSTEAHAYLRALGAGRIVPRSEFEEGPARPMDSGRWAGAIDAVGGDTLATILSQVQRHGSVAAFGNAGGHALHMSVLPFILRGVNLLGIDSNTCPNARRRTAWKRLAEVLTDAHYERIHTDTIALDAIPEAARRIVEGQVQGRILVDLAA